MTTPHPPSAAGPATRAVYESYHRELAVRRRWRVVERTAVVVLASTAVLTLVSGPLGFTLPQAFFVSPAGILFGWLLWRDQVLTLLGRPPEPRFPSQMLEIALRADESARTPRSLGVFPPSVETFPRETR